MCPTGFESHNAYSRRRSGIGVLVTPPPRDFDVSSPWEPARPADALRDLLDALARGTIPSRCLVTTLTNGALPEVTQMRQLLEAFIDVQALDSDRFLLVLAAHELLTNAVLHGELPPTVSNMPSGRMTVLALCRGVCHFG